MRFSALASLSLLAACSTPDPHATLGASRGLAVTDVTDLMTKKGLTADEIATLPDDFLARTLRRIREPRPDHAGEAEEYRLQSLRSEDGTIPHNADLTAKQQMAALQLEGISGGLDSTRWTDLGPGNIGGRIRAIAIHPTTPATMFVGSVAGGIWRSNNAGASWAPVDDLMTNLSITTIAFTPGNPTVMYASTGEGFRNGDAVRGAGVFKSTDGGVSWAQIPSTNTSDFYYVTRLSISPDASTILISTRTGIYRSTNAGVSWTRVHGSASAFCLDVKFHPTSSNVAICHIGDASQSTVAYTTNGGASWTNASGIATSGSTTTRIELAWHKGWTGAGNGCCYALKDSSSTLYRSVDGGANWTQVSTATILGSQGWYDDCLWVDPSDTDANTADDVLMAGGIDQWRSTNGGSTWTKVSQWSSWPNSAHADQHVILEHPQFNGTTNRTVYFGNDGGIWRTDNVYAVANTSGWVNLNNSLRITQFYGGSRNATAGILIGGTQDNGTLRRTEASGQNGWTTMFGGDGGFCASNANTSTYHYGEYVYLQIHRSTNSGSSSSYIYSGIGDAGSAANFIAPFILDPNVQTTMLGGGLSLWRSTNATAGTPTWASIKASVGSNISAITVQEGNSDVIWVGHNNGDVYRTTNGTNAAPTWTKMDDNPAALPGRKVMRVTLDPANANRVFVCFAGYNTDNLWESTNGGATWASKPGMPAAPVRDVEIHPARGTYLYAGSEVGLLVSENGGTSWSSSATPAYASIDELMWSGGELYMITHARGMFRQRPLTLASAISRGAPCTYNGGSAGPTLSVPDPVLGTRITFLASGGPVNGAGVLYLSGVPGGPIQISPGCFLQLDLLTMVSVGGFAFNNTGIGLFPVDLPSTASLVGGRVMTQVAAVTGLTIQLSNGQELVLGY